MTLREDPITGELRLVAPGRADRLAPRPRGCPFCPGNEAATPPETGRVPTSEHAHAAGVDAAWTARSFPNLFPLTDPHEVLVPSPRHVTAWRDLTLPELEAGIELLVRRRAALLAPGRYVHAFVNDGVHAGASLPHVHAQLVSVPAEGHAARLTHGVRDGTGHCALCAIVGDHDSPYMVERGACYALVAHPLPRLTGALLITPLAHDSGVQAEPVAELAALLHRALQAVTPDAALNMWLVADEASDTHWYLELQPRTAHLAGVELALGLSVVARDPQVTAGEARERLGMPVQH